jgi:hypothetical protein
MAVGECARFLQDVFSIPKNDTFGLPSKHCPSLNIPFSYGQFQLLFTDDVELEYLALKKETLFVHKRYKEMNYIGFPNLNLKTLKDDMMATELKIVLSEQEEILNEVKAIKNQTSGGYYSERKGIGTEEYEQEPIPLIVLRKLLDVLNFLQRFCYHSWLNSVYVCVYDGGGSNLNVSRLCMVAEDEELAYFVDNGNVDLNEDVGVIKDERKKNELNGFDKGANKNNEKGSDGKEKGNNKHKLDDIELGLVEDHLYVPSNDGLYKNPNEKDESLDLLSVMEIKTDNYLKIPSSYAFNQFQYVEYPNWNGRPKNSLNHMKNLLLCPIPSMKTVNRTLNHYYSSSKISIDGNSVLPFIPLASDRINLNTGSKTSEKNGSQVECSSIILDILSHLIVSKHPRLRREALLVLFSILHPGEKVDVGNMMVGKLHVLRALAQTKIPYSLRYILQLCTENDKELAHLALDIVHMVYTYLCSYNPYITPQSQAVLKSLIFDTVFPTAFIIHWVSTVCTIHNIDMLCSLLLYADQSVIKVLNEAPAVVPTLCRAIHTPKRMVVVEVLLRMVVVGKSMGQDLTWKKVVGWIITKLQHDEMVGDFFFSFFLFIVCIKLFRFSQLYVVLFKIRDRNVFFVYLIVTCMRLQYVL